MKFLDETGLGYFLDKLKSFIAGKYVAINSAISINDNDGNIILNSHQLTINDLRSGYNNSLTVGDGDGFRHLYYDCDCLTVEHTKLGEPTRIYPDNIKSQKIIKINATSSQFLMGDGSVTEFNKANGVPKLDANGKLDSAQIVALSNSDIDAIVI